MPYYGGSGDVGIMQMCWARTNEHLWNWHDNIDSGRDTLAYMKNVAKNDLDEQVANGATPYTTEQWRDEGIHRYNAGNDDDEDRYWEWNPNTTVWVPVARGGAPGYLAAVTAIDLNTTCN